MKHTLKLCFSKWLTTLLVLLLTGIGNPVLSQCLGTDFTIQSNGNCAPATFVFNSTGVNPGSTIEWQVNGTPFSSNPVATRTFPNGGVYTVSLIVTPPSGTPCPTVSKTVSVINAPIVSIQTSPNVAQTFCGKKTITISAQSTSGIASINWYFENSAYTSTSFTHKFTSGGSYPITLQIVDTNGCTAVLQDSIVITMVNKLTGANFNISTSVGCSPLNTALDANLNIPANSTVDSAVWVFPGTILNNISIPGPITQSNLPTQYLNNLKAGVYPVKLISYINGCDFSIPGNKDTIYVDTATTPQILKYAPNSDTLCSGSLLNLVNNTPNFLNLKGNFQWVAPTGNPKKSNKSLQGFYFETPGFHTISLNYYSLCGDTNTTTKTVFIQGAFAGFNYDTIEQSSCFIPHTTIFGPDTSIVNNPNLSFFWEFFDLNGVVVDSSNLKYPTKTYSAAGVYKVQLTVTDISTGCQHTIANPKMISVGNPTPVTSTTTPPAMCAPATFDMQLYNQTIHAPGYVYTWNIFDQSGKKTNTFKGRFPKITLSVPGVYDVQLIAVNNKVCGDTIMLPQYFEVQGAKGVFMPTIKANCLPSSGYTETFSIDSVSTTPVGKTVYYKWFVSPTAGTTITNPDSATTTIQFTEKGCYRIWAEMMTEDSCAFKFPKRSLCLDAEADFETDRDSVCLGGNIQITNKSSIKSGNGSTYLWTANSPNVVFSPNNTDKNPTISFTGTGTFDISLIFTNQTGCVDTVTKSIKCFQYQSRLIASDTNISCGPALIRVKANAPSSTVYKWYLTGFQTNIFIQNTAPNDSLNWFVSSGTYTVTCVSTSQGGCIDSATTKIFVGGARPRFYSLSPLKGCAPYTMSFRDTSARVDSIYFDFGDNSPVLNTNNYPVNGIFSHTYDYPYATSTADSIVYEPTLIVKNNQCPSPAVLAQKVVVYPTPQIKYSANTFAGCKDLFFALSDSSTFAPNGSKYVLEYGDGQIDTNTNGQFSHTYTTPGAFTPIYKIIPPNGCTADSVLPQVFVYGLPQANFTVLNDSLCFQGNQVDFQDLSSTAGYSNITSWKWYFNDPASLSDTSNAQNPTYQYLSSGTFGVSLTVMNAQGCKDSIYLPNAITILDTLDVENKDLAFVTVQGLGTEINWNTTSDPKFNGYHLYKYNPGQQLIFSTNNRAIQNYSDASGDALNGPVSYRLAVEDKCINTQNFGEVHRTIYVQGISVVEGEVNLSWTPYLGWKNIKEYNIYASSGNTSHPTLVAKTNGSDTTATIKGLCNTTYFFVVEAVNAINPNIVSKSNVISQTPLYKFPNNPPVVSAVTIRNNASVELTWEASTYQNTKGYVISRKRNDGPWKNNYGYSSTNIFIDQNVNVGSDRYYYRIQMEDVCGNLTDTSHSSSPILLEAKSNNVDGIEINWSAYQKWDQGVLKYEIYKTSQNQPRKKIATVSGNTLSFIDNTPPENGDGNQCYEVVAIERGGQGKSTSNQACDNYPVKLFIPTAFSPNNDGLNDEFTIVGISFQMFRMTVFDRWGNVVYHNENPSIAWNGDDAKGSPLGAGKYVYRIFALNNDGEWVEKNGTITLIR